MIKKVEDKKPLVSFCILTYNQENFIADAIKGALSQTYENLEIIVSDDCSTDNTFEIANGCVKKYTGPHKILLRKNETNMGIAQHCNMLLYELSKGDIVLLSGGDDVSLPQRAEISVDYFLRFPEISSLSFRSEQVDVNLKRIDANNYDGVSKGQFSILTLEDYCRDYKLSIFSGDSRALRRNVINAFPPLSGVRAEDIYLFFRSFLVGPICYIREPLVLRRIHGNNVSMRKTTNAKVSNANYHKMEKQFLADVKYALDNKLISQIEYKYASNKITNIVTEFRVSSFRSLHPYMAKLQDMLVGIAKWIKRKA